MFFCPLKEMPFENVADNLNNVQLILNEVISSRSDENVIEKIQIFIQHIHIFQYNYIFRYLDLEKIALYFSYGYVSILY